MAQQTEHVTNNHTLTAVEWLVEQLIPENQHEGIMDIIEDAKQREKEQIIDAFDNGTTDENLIGKEYYNETYNK
jgi:hypothetical protein